jgi:hypothetical protein
MAGAYGAVVRSWFPLDLGNVRLTRALLVRTARARPGLIPERAIAIALALRSAADPAVLVDRLVSEGIAPEIINTGLYLALLRRLPAPSERDMVASRQPQIALMAILSGDEFRRAGRRTLEA